jgi:hypothetical protein
MKLVTVISSLMSGHVGLALKGFISLFTIVGTLAKLFKMTFDPRSQVQSTKDVGEIVESALKFQNDDPAYSKLLKDVIKEQAVSAIFKVSIKTGEIGGLMQLYSRGIASISDIRKAFPFMNLTGSKVEILADWDDQFLLYIVWGGLIFGAALLVLGCVVLPFTRGPATGSLLLAILTYLFIILAIAASCEGLFIAHRLKRQLRAS